MTSQFPSPAPRRLERSRSNRVLGGVCGGVATYLNMDPTLVRVLTVVLTLFTGVPVVVYLVLLLVVPEEGSDTPPGYSGGAGQTIPSTRPSTGDPVWGATGAPWDQPAPTQPPPAEPAPGPSSVPPATEQREEPGEQRPNGELR